MSYANKKKKNKNKNKNKKKNADKPVHSCDHIVVRCLDKIIPIATIYELHFQDSCYLL